MRIVSIRQAGMYGSSHGNDRVSRPGGRNASNDSTSPGNCQMIVVARRESAADRSIAWIEEDGLRLPVERRRSAATVEGAQARNHFLADLPHVVEQVLGV
jgi:hypothetical protein